jgi:predicted TIM-barrel fold metal-dependent hydrolase
MTATFNTTLPKNWIGIRKIDAHMHVPGPPEVKVISGFSIEDTIESADRLGIDQMWISVPISAGRFASIEEVRLCNDATLKAMRMFPDRFIGYCFVIPGVRESFDEIERCLGEGMSGIKLYNQYKYSEPVLDPIAEKAIEHGIPILGHAGHICDPETKNAQPRCSDAADFVELARRYPEVMLIEGHISGGGDWEWSVRELRDCPNVYLDTSGSNIDDRTIEMCVEMLGAERVLFATDMSMEAGIGKILSAELTDEQFELVWWKNMQRIKDQRK